MGQIVDKGSNFKIVLFGTMHFVRDSEFRLPCGAKNRLLVSYIALFPDRLHARDKLAGIVWPDTGQEQAKGNLRHALSEIRKELGPMANPALYTEHGAVMLRTGEVETDVQTIERLLELGDAASVEKAFGAADGTLLEDVDELWAVTERQHVDWTLREAGTRAVSNLLASRETERAIRLCEELLRRERGDEQAHRMLLQAHARRHDLLALARQYERCETAMREELDADPASETTLLYQRLRAELAG